MPNVKTSEVIASSPRGWEDAVSAAVERAHKTLAGLQEVEVIRLTAKVEGGTITEYRVHLKIHFILDADYPMHE